MKFKLAFNFKWLWLILILVFAGATRLWRLNLPAKPYFDEIYHLPAARLIANNDPRAYEWWHRPIALVSDNDEVHDWLHPPLAKLIQAGSIRLFGDQPFSWRLPSALAGIFLIAAVFILARKIFTTVYSQDKAFKLALVAALLLSLDGLVLTQSRIMMNDIFVTLFSIIAMIFVLRWQPQLLLFKLNRFKQRSLLNLLVAGFFLGLAVSSKWSALFLIVLLVLLFLWLLVEHKLWRMMPITFFSLIVVPTVVYLASYSQMFVQGKNLTHFVKLHEQIWHYQTQRQEGHRYASNPSLWLINLRPVWYWTASSDQPDFNQQNQTANIYALGNPALHLVALMALIYVIGSVTQDHAVSQQSQLYLNLLIFYGVMWLPWLLSPRVMFYYHYLLAVPWLAMIVADFLTQKMAAINHKLPMILMGIILITFIVFYPHWIGLPVSKSWAKTIYWLLPSWR